MKTPSAFISIILLVAVAAPSFSEASDLSTMTKARGFFSNGQLDKAFAEYEKVPQSSDFWLEATEEKAHIMGRKKEYAKALAMLATPMSSVFVDITGPEPYFVAALTHLKICDYSSIFKVSKLFKERFSPRVAKLEVLQKTGQSEAVRQMIKRLDSAPLSTSTLGVLAKDLPRNLQRDKILHRLSLQKASPDRNLAIQDRLKVLARLDLKEIEDNVNKLQILEAEVIQRIHLAEKNKSKRERQGQFNKNNNTLTFPYSGEVWLDELDNYQASVEKCAELSKRAAL